MGKVAPLFAAILVGVAVATQGPINSELSRHVGQFRAVMFSVTVTALTVLIILIVRADAGSFSGLAHTPRWAMVGGFLGIVSLLGAIIAVPRIGAAATTGAIVAGQIAASAIIDRFGLLGVAARPLSPGRLAGLALIVGAVALVTRG